MIQTIKERAEEVLSKDNLSIEDLKEFILEMVDWQMHMASCEMGNLKYSENAINRTNSSILHCREQLEKKIEDLEKLQNTYSISDMYNRKEMDDKLNSLSETVSRLLILEKQTKD